MRKRGYRGGRRRSFKRRNRRNPYKIRKQPRPGRIGYRL